MALAVLVEDMGHGLIGDRPDLVVQGARQPVGRAAIDDDHALAGDDEAEIVVVAGILIGGRRGGADGGPDAGDELHRLGIEQRAGILVGDILAGEGGTGEEGEGGDKRASAHTSGTKR